MFAPQRPKECRPPKLALKFRKERTMVVFHLIYGLESRIPLCCILAFCARHLFMEDSTSPCHGNWSCRAHYSHCWLHRRTDHYHAVPQSNHVRRCALLFVD